MTLANQNSARNAVLRGQEYYRLKQEIQSPGDIFELDESTRAIYIGPDSDIAEVQATYYDEDRSTGLETATIAVNGPFVGRFDALLATKVPSTGEPARILVSPVDLVDNSYVRPAATNFGPFRSFNVPARIDLIASLKTLPDIPSVRADRTLRYPNTPFEESAPFGTDGSTDLVIPVYGRRLISVQIVSPNNQGNEISFYLVALQPGAPTEPKLLGSIVTVGAASVGFTKTAVIRATSEATNFPIAGTAPAETIEFFPTIAQGPKGLGDLLIVNIKENITGAPPPQNTQFLDVFVKISDREV